MSFEIFTDSASDLPEEIVNEYGIKILPLFYIVEGEEKPDYGATSPKVRCDQYAMLRDDVRITTAAANAEYARPMLEDSLKAGKDILYLGFSTALSLTYKNISELCEQLKKEYPSQKILYLDTMNASLGEGLIINKAAELRAEGSSIDEVYSYINENKLKFVSYFTVENLKYLHAGGRVSRKQQLFADILNVKPIMHVSADGNLEATGKVFGRKLSLSTLAKMVVSTAINPAETTLFIGHGDCIADVHYLLTKIEEQVKFKKVVINYVGMVIGAHSGPGTVAVFCEANDPLRV